jgi:hypothetical protein
MTRRNVYWAGLAAFGAATAMMLISIGSPDWVSFKTQTTVGDYVYKRVGLHQTCTNLPEPRCTTFPDEQLCTGDERTFCDMWRTVGFLANLSAIVHLAGVVAFVVVMAGGKYQRERGWPLIGGLLAVASVVEFFIIAIVSYLYDYDEQFTVAGWALDYSWYLCLASATTAALGAAGLVSSAYVLPPEDGYEFLEDPSP